MAAEHFYLFINDSELALWQGEAKQLALAATYSANTDGVAAFEAFIELHRTAHWFVLFDLQEEDYRIETIPHVNARDRKIVVGRRLDQLYRESRYRSATPQGRETTGRRDDRVLLAALTNPAPLDLWLTPLVARQAKIVGVYSISLLIARHAKDVSAIPHRALIMSRQTGSGLRQTYLADNTLRFSRLTPLEGESVDELMTQLGAEATRARQFLASLRAIDRTEVMHVVMICSESEQAELQTLGHDAELIHYHFVSTTALATALGVRADPTLAVAEPIWLRFIASKRPHNQYATLEQRKPHILWQTSRLLLGGAAGALLLCLTGGAYLRHGAQVLDDQTTALKQRHIAATLRIAQNASITHEGDLSPTGMKNVVQAYRDLVERWPNLHTSLVDVSTVMATFPAMELDEFGWLVVTDPKSLPPGFAAAEGGSQAATPVADAAGATVPVTQRWVVIGVRGRLAGYATRYREALKLVDEISAAFALRPGIQVEKLELPLDIRQERSIDLGNAGEAAPVDAPFSLVIRVPLPATGVAP